MNENKIIKVGLFGCGKWGSIIADKIVNHPRYELSFISTWSGKIPDKFKHIKKFNGWGTDQTNEVDLIYASAYPKDHYSIIREAIISNKPIVCEKPIVENFEQFKVVDAYMHFCNYKNLFVANFTQLFNEGFIQFIDQLVKLDQSGTLYFNVRGPNKRDKISVKHDYGSHVIAMIIFTMNKFGYKTSEIDWDIKENGGIFNIGKYTGVFSWENKEERDVSVGFINDGGESLWWRDDRNFDSLSNLLTYVSRALSQNTKEKSSNFQLAGETVFALDEKMMVEAKS